MVKQIMAVVKFVNVVHIYATENSASSFGCHIFHILLTKNDYDDSLINLVRIYNKGNSEIMFEIHCISPSNDNTILITKIYNMPLEITFLAQINNISDLVTPLNQLTSTWDIYTKINIHKRLVWIRTYCQDSSSSRTKCH